MRPTETGADAEPATRGLTLALTPVGHRLLTEAAEDEVPLPGNVAARVVQAWAGGSAQGVLHLGWVEAHAVLPPVFAFWRELAREVVSGVCTTPGVEYLRRCPATSAPR